MAISRAQPFTFQMRGVSDALDGGYAFDGACSALANLAPNPDSAGQFVPRTAAVQLSNFSGFTTPGEPTALLIVGTLAYGMVPSGRFAGKDEPFCYDMVNGVFLTLANVTAANCPATQPTTGDWNPPTMAMITNGRIMITHPGYDGVSNFVGWLDISSANLTGLTGNTHSSTLIDGIPSSPILAGFQVGMGIAGAGIPAGTYVTKMDAASVTLSQAATATAAGVALTVTGGSPATPLYGAGNLNGNPLAAIATCVALYSSRAWYGMQNYAIYSDTLNPTQITNANQALQIGDSTAVTAMAGLPLTSQVNGGTLQSLIVFKGGAPFTQITGDAALQTLSQNVVNGSVGTLAPNTICATPQGLAYVAPDGVRLLGLDGVVTPVIGAKGQGVSRPFLNALAPSRMCAAYNEKTLRISVQNLIAPGTGLQEWWLDMEAGIWTGPHTAPARLMRPCFASGAYPFISTLSGVSGALWGSATIPHVNATFVENSVQLTTTIQTPLLPDNQQMAMNCVVESTFDVQMRTDTTLTIIASDETGAVMDTVTLMPTGIAAPVWGAFNWGGGSWGYTLASFRQWALHWHQPLVFKQASLQITGVSQAGLIFGDLRFEYTPLNYLVT